MTLGDALALSKSVPSDNDEMTLDQAMGNSSPTDTFVPTISEEHKVGFVKGMAMRFDAGIKNAAAGMYDISALLASASPADWAFGGAISKKLKGVAKWERGLAEEQKQKSASKNRGVQLAGEFVESAANLGYTLPVDILTGGQTKLALAGKVMPKVEAILSRIPDFALGQGWRSMIEGTQKEGNVIERTGAGIAGAGEGVAWGTVYGKAGSSVKAIPVMTSLGWGSSFYEALKENRLPTKDEQISGVAIGTAYGVAFALLPHLKKATKISPEKTALGKYEKLINEHANNGDFDKVKETVDTLMADEKIRPEVKEALGKVLEVPQIKAETPVSGTITPQATAPKEGGGIYYHATNQESANVIKQKGFEARVGDRSLASTKGKGVWLYENSEYAKEFGKNFKNPVTIETKVEGKIFDATNNDKGIRELAGDTKLIRKLKSEGYIGITGDEMGVNATFIFEPSKLSLTGEGKVAVPKIPEGKIPTGKVKGIIRANTGQIKVGDVIRESDALKRLIRREGQLAREYDKEKEAALSEQNKIRKFEDAIHKEV
jgi:hypothetical protein